MLIADWPRIVFQSCTQPLDCPLLVGNLFPLGSYPLELQAAYGLAIGPVELPHRITEVSWAGRS